MGYVALHRRHCILVLFGIGALRLMLKIRKQAGNDIVGPVISMTNFAWTLRSMFANGHKMKPLHFIVRDNNVFKDMRESAAAPAKWERHQHVLHQIRARPRSQVALSD